MKTLITGGAGFIGSHLAEALLAQGSEVTVLDDLSSGRLDNLATVASHPKLEIALGDVRDAARVDALAESADIIYHLAAWNRPRCEDNLPEAIQVHVAGVASVLAAAARHSIRMVHVSCSEVYGKGKQQPLREDGECRLGPTHEPAWAFASMKLMAEALCTLSAEKGLPVTILRLFDVYGPRDRSGLTSQLLQLKMNAHPHAHADGILARSLMYISDAVDALVLAGQAAVPAGEVINIGWDRPACQACVRPDASNLWVADRTKARRLLSFEPKVTLEEGLHLTQLHRRHAQQ